MNNIGIKQNEPKQLERLAAQRELYSSAKRILAFQIFTTVLLPIVLSAYAFLKPNIAPYAACYGLFTTLFNILILEKIIKNRREEAAKIQELFDCDVLVLEKSPYKIIDDVTVEKILFHYKAHSKIATNIEKIKDWYPKNIQNLPLHIARIICQRENCWWDGDLRKRYAKFLIILSVFLFIAIIFFAVMNNLKFIDLVLLSSALFPIFQFSIKQIDEHNVAAKKLDELIKNAENLWNISLAQNVSEEVMTEKSRRLQDEIFEHRSKSPLILDFIYNWLRNKNEDLINGSTEKRLQDAKAKGFE